MNRQLLLSLSVMLILFSMTTSAELVQIDPYHQLMLNMPFEKPSHDNSNNVYDYSAYNHHATEQDAPGGNTNPPQWLTTDSSNRNGLYYFDGQDDYLGFSTPFNFEVGQPFTINLWIKALQVNSGNQFIIGNRDPVPRGWNLRIRANQRLALVLEDGPNLAIAESNFRISPGRWYQVMAVYDGNKPYLFVDWVQQNGKYSSGSITSLQSTRNMRVGLTPTNGWGFNGYIDNLKIWRGRVIS